MARIVAHFTQDDEREAAQGEMVVYQQTESFLLGEADEDAISRMEEEGLIVERVAQDPQAIAETPGAVSPGAMVSALAQGRGTESAFAQAFVDQEPTIDSSGPNFYLIGLLGPLLEPWRQEFDSLGVELLERVPPSNYTAKLTVDQVRQVSDLPFVSGVRLYNSDDATSVQAQQAAPPPPGVERAMLTYDARLHRAEDMERVLNWLREHNVTVAGTGKQKIRLYLLADSPLREQIEAVPEIAELQPYVTPRIYNDVARVLLGLEGQAQQGAANGLPQAGDGQIVAVADTGIDEDHPDFQGRIRGVVALGRPGDSSDTAGHGTHVAGSVLGDGSASGGKIRGTAPKAELFFQSLLDAGGHLGGLPVDLGDLFEEAYQAGARIHNNSWGARTNSVYTLSSVEVDEFVAQHRDMLIVIAAGNEGQAKVRVNTPEGFVDWLSVSSPATSKNALTVGASRSNRTSGGYANFTFGGVMGAWPEEFPDPPISEAQVSGDPEGLSAFSSRGPCDDRRIKPDVVAPGTNIVSAKSSRAPLREFWGAYPDNNHYAFMGGTSMAAPLVAGCAALVREHYVKERAHNPSAALLKATIINGTRWLTGDDADPHPSDLPNGKQAYPNFHQGFGCAYMPWTIPNPSTPELKLEFLDTWEDQAHQFVRTGQAFRFRMSVAAGTPLRICLAWTDPPQRALMNNLDLVVQHLESREKWTGNDRLPLGITPLDVENNVEVVRLDDPPAGEYLIQVAATNLTGPRGDDGSLVPQDFALVVAAELTSSLIQI